MLKWTIFLILHASYADPVLATNCVKIWLTVSSLWRPIAASNEVINTELEINWSSECTSEDEYPDSIRVFSSSPRQNKTLKPSLIFHPMDFKEGYFRTNISVGRPSLSGGWDVSGGATLPGSHCLKHYAALYKNETLLSTTCLRIWPTWMYDFRRQLGRLPIGALMIPGTHNSGCYQHGELTRSEAFRLGYFLTQDRDVWTQLVHGIRYFDFRVGYYPVISNHSNPNNKSENHDSGFWINHDIIRIRHLSMVLRKIRNFLEAARGEVVILDFHRFPVGLDENPTRHRLLVSMLHREFDGLILKPQEGIQGLGPTLNDIWHSGKRVIICYGDKHTVNEYDWLWPPMSQAWGNQQTPEGLMKYLNDVVMSPQRIRNGQNPLWAVMAELTPKLWDVLFKVSDNLRQLADLVNRNLTKLFEENLWKQTNVVASDFFLGNNLIEVSIQSNIKKSNIAQWLSK